MTRELMILRHGKSSWKDLSLEDYDRPLKKRGIAASRKMGRYLVHRKLRPEIIISSTAERARHTAVLACREMGITERHISWDRDLYHAHVHTLLNALSRCKEENKRVMLVGHNPGLEELIAYLCANGTPLPEDGKLLPTAALVRIAMPDDWNALGHGCAEFVELVHPRALTLAGRVKDDV
ncbi:MAG: histidine phosphatase family protein [Acidobacteriota bacterium]|nr:histidine phosphatase family protein [Acidobacteriota bacterium]